MVLGHDFLSSNLRQTSWLHRRCDVDYNGWWMCLIPTAVIREIGLSLPLFIKWDDSEYGLRAKAHGFPTVSLPGSAVWHVSWIDKDDLVGWQAYFHARNRIMAALLHSPYEYGGRVVRESQYADIKHLVSMQYATAHGRGWALEDVLKGPSGLPELLPSKLPEIRKMMAGYSDSIFRAESRRVPDAQDGQAAAPRARRVAAVQDHPSALGGQDGRTAALPPGGQDERGTSANQHCASGQPLVADRAVRQRHRLQRRRNGRLLVQAGPQARAGNAHREQLVCTPPC